MSKFNDIMEVELKNNINQDSKELLSMVCAVFGLTSEQVGAMFNPPKSAHTVNGYRRKGFTELGAEGEAEVRDFIEKWYRGKNPRRNLLNKIKRLIS